MKGDARIKAPSRCGHDIYARDSGCLRPVLAAIHLIVEDRHVAIVDTGS